ncbi:MAG: hypothetical protein ACOYZ8_06680 [Chloroflexota bacterium]
MRLADAIARSKPNNPNIGHTGSDTTGRTWVGGNVSVTTGTVIGVGEAGLLVVVKDGSKLNVGVIVSEGDSVGVAVKVTGIKITNVEVGVFEGLCVEEGVSVCV